MLLQRVCGIFIQTCVAFFIQSCKAASGCALIVKNSKQRRAVTTCVWHFHTDVCGNFIQRCKAASGCALIAKKSEQRHAVTTCVCGIFIQRCKAASGYTGTAKKSEQRVLLQRVCGIFIQRCKAASGCAGVAKKSEQRRAVTCVCVCVAFSYRGAKLRLVAQGLQAEGASSAVRNAVTMSALKSCWAAASSCAGRNKECCDGYC